MRFRLPFLLLFALILFAAAGCDFPHDQHGTLKRVKNERRIRVGLVENKPWVIRGNAGEPSGVEVELVRQFAAELGASPEWVWGGEEEIFTALENYELDLAVGGIIEKTPYKKKIALTNPYFTDQIAVGSNSAAKLEEIEGKTVAVERGDVMTAALVSEKEAAPEYVERLSPEKYEFAAASDWRLKQAGYNLTDVELQKNKRVFAVAHGENGWLVRLEEFCGNNSRKR